MLMTFEYILTFIRLFTNAPGPWQTENYALKLYTYDIGINLL